MKLQFRRSRRRRAGKRVGARDIRVSHCKSLPEFTERSSSAGREVDSRKREMLPASVMSNDRPLRLGSSLGVGEALNTSSLMSSVNTAERRVNHLSGEDVRRANSSLNGYAILADE